MRAVWCGYVLIACGVVGVWNQAAHAEQILTADGESFYSSGTTMTNRQLSIPQEGMPAKLVALDDLVEYSQSVNRELGDLKTRYVRVESLNPEKTNLSLAEVLVFEGDKNVAREGKATQAGVDYDGPPERAIDGNTDGNLEVAKSTTHTAYVEHPWWEVDLQRDVSVRQVEIWNRLDNNTGFKIGERLNNSCVILLDANRKPLWVHYIDKADPKRMSYKIPLKGSQFGRNDTKQFERYAGVTESSNQSMNDPESELELVGGGTFIGTITAWTAEVITVDARFGDQTRTLTIPPAAIREIRSKEVATGKLKLTRTGEVADADNVYAKSDSGEVQRVSGKVIGREGESLLFEIEGQTRKLNWAKVAGLVFRVLPPTPSDSAYELVDFTSGQHLSGRCTNLTADVFQMETIWKQSIELPRSQLAHIVVKNGRVVSLLEKTPSQVEQANQLITELNR